MLRITLKDNKDKIPPCYCGNKNYKRVYSGLWKTKTQRKSFSILKCNNCGLLRTNPLPKTDLSKEYIENKISKIKLWENFSKRVIDLIIRYKQTDKPKVLDIGASVGILIRMVKSKDWEGVGIDIDKRAVEIGKRKYGINLLYGNLEDNNFAENSFDVIVLSHTLEHILDLNKLFKNVNKILKPKGLLIIEVPNIKGLPVYVQKFRNRKWYGYDPENHVWHFTPETIRNLITGESFEILELNVKIPLYYEDQKKFTGLLRKLILQLSSVLGKADQIIVVAKSKK